MFDLLLVTGVFVSYLLTGIDFMLLLPEKDGSLFWFDITAI
jgi:hypothetical protein